MSRSLTFQKYFMSRHRSFTVAPKEQHPTLNQPYFNMLCIFLSLSQHHQEQGAYQNGHMSLLDIS